MMKMFQGLRMPANKKEDIIAYLEPYAEIFSGRLSFRADMRKITWFRTGGSAAALFQPKDEEDLQNFLKVLPEEIPLVMVGIGSNILVRDGGIEGVVLRLPTQAFGEVNWLSDTQVKVGCALSDKKLAQLTAQKGIGGFHFFYGIPGNIGGALRMNAGIGNESGAQVHTLRVQCNSLREVQQGGSCRRQAPHASRRTRGQRSCQL